MKLRPPVKLQLETLSPLDLYRGRKAVLSNVELSIRSGEVCLLSGKNGSGKTTLLRALAGLLPIGAGVVCVAGHRLPGTRTSALVKSGVRFLSQSSRCFPGFTVERQRSVLSVVHGMKNSAHAGLEIGASNTLQDSSNLSIGERKIEALRTILVGHPTLMLLDEPLAGIASDWRKDVICLIDRLKRTGVAFLVSEHESGELEEVTDTELCLDTDYRQVIALD